MTDQALSHLRVVDLTHYVSGPYCTKLLAGFGAEVIKIEPPQTGDKLRHLGPFYRDGEDLERSIPFLWLNTGKKSVTLNLKTDKGLEVLKRLVKSADVLVENFSPRVMPGLGFSPEVLRDLNPRLVVASISSFGQTGPYRDYRAQEIQLQALSGMMHMTGEAEKPPLASGPAICQYSAGVHAYCAVLMALFQRGNNGQGQYVEVSVLECALEHIELTLAKFLQLGKQGRRSEHLLALWDLYPCRDGYAAVISAPVRHWLKGAWIFDEPRLLDEKYRHMTDRMRHRQELEDLIRPWLNAHDKQEIFELGQAQHLAFGYLATLPEVLASPQHRSREFFVEVDHPAAGRHRYGGAPFKMSETPWRSHRAPLLGEHNQDIYAGELAYAPGEIKGWREAGII